MSKRRPRVDDRSEISARPKIYAPVDPHTSYDDRFTFISVTDSSPTTAAAPTTVHTEGGGCAAYLKYGIYFANIVFLVVGAMTLAMGIWLRTDSRFRGFLSERYRQVVGDAFWEAPTLFIFSYILIVLGACMIVVAFIGCCGASSNNRCFVIIYAMVVFVMLIATLSCGIYILFKTDAIDVEVSDALNYMVQHYYQGAGIVQESLDRLQTTFRCCGAAGCSDFRAFRQDPPRSCDIRCDGCHFRIMVALKIGYSITLVVYSVVILCQILTIAFSLYIAFNREERVRVLYVPERARMASPAPSVATSGRLTKEALRRHDLPYELEQREPYRYY